MGSVFLTTSFVYHIYVMKVLIAFKNPFMGTDIKMGAKLIILIRKLDYLEYILMLPFE